LNQKTEPIIAQLEADKKLAYDTDKRVIDFFEKEMALLKDRMESRLPPDPEKLQKLMNAHWWQRNFESYSHKKALVLLALTILAMSFFMSVLSSPQPS
jgi:hypothetical protein